MEEAYSPHSPSKMLRPVAYKFRFTFTDQDKEHAYTEDKSRLSKWRRIAQRLKAETLEKYAHLGKITGGIEYCNKLGEYTYAHFHLHFYSVAPRDTIAKQYRRNLEGNSESADQVTRGVKAFYLHAEPIRDDDKFFRYPLKQNLVTSLCSGYTAEQLQLMHEVANDSWKIGCEVSLSKADKRDSQDTLFDRARAVISKNKPKGRFMILKEFIIFYQAENKPINKTVILGYVLLYQLAEGLITVDQLCEEWEPKDSEPLRP